MNKIDEIRRRINSTDPDKPIVMPWERDDFNYLLDEIERIQVELAQYKAVVEATKAYLDWLSSSEPYDPYMWIRMRTTN